LLVVAQVGGHETVWSGDGHGRVVEGGHEVAEEVAGQLQRRVDEYDDLAGGLGQRTVLRRSEPDLTFLAGGDHLDRATTSMTVERSQEPRRVVPPPFGVDQDRDLGRAHPGDGIE